MAGCLPFPLTHFSIAKLSSGILTPVDSKVSFAWSDNRHALRQAETLYGPQRAKSPRATFRTSSETLQSAAVSVLNFRKILAQVWVML